MNKKKIWIVAQAAQQPPYNTMLRYHNWGKQLIKRGYDVSVFAANRVHNTQIDVVKEIGSHESVCDGVRYVYLDIPQYHGNGIKRILGWLVFNKRLSSLKNELEKPDAIICGTIRYETLKKMFNSIPIIVDTVDLWPLSIIQYANISKYNPFIQYLYYLEKKVYIEADALIFSMEGGEEYLRERKYANKINYEKVFHINMGCDIEQKDQELRDISFDLGWDETKFNLVYCGSIRQANQVQQICDAAKALQDRGVDNVAFQIYGNGTDLEKLKKYIKDNGISNVTFYGRIDKAQIPYILSHADANILTYKQVGLMKYGGSQSKLFDYLASGKPIICNAKFGYNLIERYSCGVVTENQTPEAFVKAVEYLLALSDEQIAEMGKNSRKAAEMYDQPKLVDKLCEAIDFVVNS